MNPASATRAVPARRAFARRQLTPLFK